MSKKEWNEQADVIIVGSGFAGLAAGIEAREKDASIKIIEKGRAGGNSIIFGGYVAGVNTSLQKEKGIEDSADFLLEDMLRAGDGLNHKELAKYLAQNIEETFEWTIDHLDVEYRKELVQMGGHSVPRSHILKTNAMLVNKQMEKLENLGGEVETKRKFLSLIGEEGNKVTGIKVEEESGAEKFIKANKGVILTTGGFANDIEMRSKQWPELTEEVPSTNHPGATGEALREAIRFGANPIQLCQIQLGPWTCPEEEGMGVGFHFVLNAAVPYGVWINPKTGQRFVDELEDRRTRARAQLKIGKDPEYPLAIVDSENMERFEESRPKLTANLLDNGILYKFNTLDELGAHFKISKRKLENEIRKYNSYIKKGEDPDFGKSIPEDAKPLEDAPWYAMRIWPKVHHTMGGVHIDKDTRVLNLSGNKISNFYAAGEVVGGVHGACRLGSCAVQDCLTYGRIAGSMAAGGANPYE